MPIVKSVMKIERQKPSEALKAFGGENERECSISDAPTEKFMDNMEQGSTSSADEYAKIIACKSFRVGKESEGFHRLLERCL